MSLGYLEKKIFPDVPDLPDLARSGQIWPDLGRLGKFFFQKKKKFFQIWPDLGGPDLEIWPDLAASVITAKHEGVCTKKKVLFGKLFFRLLSLDSNHRFFLPEGCTK